MNITEIITVSEVYTEVFEIQNFKMRKNIARLFWVYETKHFSITF